MKKKPAKNEIVSFFYFPIVLSLLLLLLRIAVTIDLNNLYTDGLGFAFVGVSILFALGFQILAVYLVLLPLAILSKRVFHLQWNIFGLIGLMIVSILITIVSIAYGIVLPEKFYFWFF